MMAREGGGGGPRLLSGPWRDAGTPGSGVTFRLLVPDDASVVPTFVGDHFVHEPMGQCLGASRADWAQFAGYFATECCANGVSVVGHDAHGRLACMLLCRDFKSPFPPGFPDSLPKFAPIIDALSSLDAVYEREHPGLELGVSLDLWMVVVSNDGSYRGKGLATTMVDLAVELARAQGYKQCVTECTGKFSQQAVLKNGFREVSHIAYKDYTYEGQRVFASIAAPHEIFGVYSRALTGAASE